MLAGDRFGRSHGARYVGCLELIALGQHELVGHRGLVEVLHGLAVSVLHTVP
jgi:hypothetical protein